MNGVRLLYVSLFILLSINLVFAGKVHDLDFSKESTIKTTINERDVVRFVVPFREYDVDKYKEGEIDYELIEKEHKVMIREVEIDRNFIRLTVFIQDAETPQYLNLGSKNAIRLDFDRDSLEDMILRLSSINDKEVTLTLEHKKEDDKTDKIVLFGLTKRENVEEKEENPILGFLSRLFSEEIFGRDLEEVKEIDEEVIVEEPIEIKEEQEKEVEEEIKEEAEEIMKEEVIEEEIAEEEGETGLEEITGLTTGRPRVINKLANNWILTLIGLVVLFLLVWNRRYIKRKTRRFFW